MLENPEEQKLCNPVSAELEPNRRVGQRHTGVLLVGRMLSGEKQAVCLIHDISRAGALVRFTTLPRVGDRLRLQMRGIPEIAATVRWVKGNKGGVEFEKEQDLPSVLQTRHEAGHVTRTPRFIIQAKAVLRVNGEAYTVDILDITLCGAKLAGQIVAQVGTDGSLSISGLSAPVFGTVCWASGDRIGFKFMEAMVLTEFARILNLRAP